MSFEAGSAPPSAPARRKFTARHLFAFSYEVHEAWLIVRLVLGLRLRRLGSITLVTDRLPPAVLAYLYRQCIPGVAHAEFVHNIRVGARSAMTTTADKYSLVDEDGRRYQLTSLINPNPDRPNLTYEFLGVTRVWR